MPRVSHLLTITRVPIAVGDRAIDSLTIHTDLVIALDAQFHRAVYDSHYT